jgi:NADH-quinone oxidoreductase subunit E
VDKELFFGILSEFNHKDRIKIREVHMAPGKEAITVDKAKIEEIIEKYRGKSGELLSILEDVQKNTKNSYLPEEALNHVALKTGVPLSRIYSIVTFYSFFNLKPQGDHTITVCRGTACHTRGSKALLDEAGIMLGGSQELESGEASFTTADNKFTVRTVACFGQCALAPVIAIDEKIYSNVTLLTLQKLIAEVSKGGKQ